MGTIEQTIARLAEPFPVDSLHFRVGATSKDKSKGIALAYIDARDAMQRLDSVVGPQNWQRRYPWSDGQRLCCEVGIRLGDEWVWKGDGAGETQVEAEKGAFSDAFKRACVNWGIGQYLYDCPNKWYPLVPAGRSFKFDDQVARQIRLDLERWQYGGKSQLEIAIERHRDSIDTISQGIKDGDLSSAAQAWFELTDDEKKSIWVAPTKGGPFTTDETKVIKSSEFRKAYYGEQ